MVQASAEKLEHTGPAEKERVASVPEREREGSWQICLSRLCQKEKEQSRLSKAPDRKVGESKVSESHTLVRKRGIKAGAWRGEGELHSQGRQVPKRTGRASKESLHRRSGRKHERVSGRTSSPEASAESWFHSMSGQT